MDFTHYDLGNLRRGQTVEITLHGSAANVQLMDSSNLQNYRSGRRYRFIGGLATRSPVILQVPNDGHWHVAVDMRGLRGTVRTAVRVVPGPLPPIAELPLSAVPSLVHPHSASDNDGPAPQYDVFISHATEDKDEVVRPLASSLVANGLTVWFDEFELRIGDSLRRKIDKGLANSRFGIVVLSRDFIRKGWTNYELDGLVTRAVSGEQVILPIWHNITKQEVVDYSPSLADKLARNTANISLQEIAEEISELILDAKD